MSKKILLTLAWIILTTVFVVGCSARGAFVGRGGGGEIPSKTDSSPTPPLAPEEPLPPPGVTSVTRTATPPPLPSPTPKPSLTPDPFYHLTIDNLAERDYGGGEITIQDTLARYERFTRYLVSYPSDGLEIYGFLNIPHGDGPFIPVVAIHGYIDPQVYDTLDYTTRYADALAQAGFVVFHPNLRGYPPSSSGPNEFRVGMAVDILNLMAIIKKLGGTPGPLANVNPSRLGLWGHSMGGGISLRVLTISPDVDAAVLYGSMSGDEAQNFGKILEWSEGARGAFELSFPVEVLSRISPINHLGRIKAAIAIHHGEGDELVPPAWSAELCSPLTTLEMPVDCYTYPGQPHTFFGDSDQLFIQRTIDFFERELTP